MKEQELYDRIRAEYSKHGRLFRNNVGTAYRGDLGKIGNLTVLKNPRHINFGLFKGSSDLIGWTEVIVTPEMVGKKIAVFTAVEVKKEGGRATKEQKLFIDIVNDAGGIGKIDVR